MPFGLVNAGATFQCVVNIKFHGMINQSVVVYLDDVTLFSKKRFDHLCHLNQIFEQCWKFKISLNPKKRIFCGVQGNLSGHVIAKSGIKVDPKSVRDIMHIPFPVNKKAMQSLPGKINFLNKFISNYAQIVKPM